MEKQEVEKRMKGRLECAFAAFGWVFQYRVELPRDYRVQDLENIPA